MGARKGEAEEKRPGREEVDPGLKSLGEALATSFRILKWIMVFLVVISLLSGIKRVEQHQVALRLRFGDLVKEKALEPGLHWSFPYPIEEIVYLPGSDLPDAVLVDRFWYKDTAHQQLRREAGGAREEGRPLRPGEGGYAITGDINVIHCRWKVNFVIEDPVRYFLSIQEAEKMDVQTQVREAGRRVVRVAVENAVIREEGRRRVDDVLRERLAELRRAVKKGAQSTLDQLDCGIRIQNLDLVGVTPPRVVRRAFDDTFQAGQEASEKIVEAEGHRNRILYETAGSVGEKLAGAIKSLDSQKEKGPGSQELEERLEKLIGEAGGDVASVISEAEAYRETVVARAEGDALYLSDILEEYRDHPEMLRVFLEDRLMEVLTEVLEGRAEAKYIITPSGEGGRRKIVIHVPGEKAKLGEKKSE